MIVDFFKQYIYVLCIALTFIGCTISDEVIQGSNIDTLAFADFVEKEFPFITTSLDLRNIGAQFPETNYLPRALGIQLGNQAYIGFDTDLLRWSVAWTGDFISMTSMAQISYKDFFNKGNSFPRILGKAQLATGIYPGWTNYRPDFTDPRPYNSVDSLKWGAIPETIGRWNGIFLHGDKTILSYTIGGTDIYEMPSSRSFENGLVFTRTFKTGAISDSLFAVVGEFNDITKTEVEHNVTFLYHGSENKITAIALSQMVPEAAVYIVDNRYVVLKFPPTSEATERTLAIWTGPIAMKSAFLKELTNINLKIPKFEKGGTPYWNEKVYTKGILAPDTSAFVLDQLTLPLPNPWKRNVRVADIDFFEDGRAAVVTFEGDVWIVDHITEKLEKLQWTRFASGLYEPMSLVIKDGLILVFGKEGIVRIHDLNDDGVADYYENFSSQILQSMDSREWPSDMVLAKDGSLYIAKGGGAISKNAPSFKKRKDAFQAASFQAGTIMKISSDGKQSEIYATGLRAPYIGIKPESGTISISDQQGNYVPATPLYLMEKGDYFGVLSASHQEVSTAVKRPLTWIPHNVDRSSISQIWITSGKMGPLNQSMVHFSFGRPGLFTVLIDSISEVKQGGVSYIKADYPAPVLKGAVHPKDGQLYIAGFNLWGSNSMGVSALTRLRYTGKPSNLPDGVRVGKQGVMLRFTQQLDEKFAEEPSNFQVKRWNYKRTEKYGSGHFKLNDEPGEETLPVISSHLSQDGKSVFIVIPNMEEVMQMQIAYKLANIAGQPFKGQFDFSVNDASKIDLSAIGFSQVKLNLNDLQFTESELSALNSQSDTLASADKGAALFSNLACIGCHSIENKTAGMYGPPLQGVYKASREFIDGSTSVADEVYLKESILKPNIKVVKGYGDEMPSFEGILSGTDLESIILYIKSLHK